MARRNLDSSSDDEYELMTPQIMADRPSNPLALSHHYATTDRSPEGTTHHWDSVTASSTLGRIPSAHLREDVTLKKKKKFFGKSKSKDRDMKPPLTKSSSFSSSKKCTPVITSPTMSNVSQKASQKASQILVLEGPPVIGPKPPKRPSQEEERVQRHKDKIAAARQSRLRRSSEPNPSDGPRIKPDGLSVEGIPVDRSYGDVEVADLINQYSDHLPLELVVSKGVYGMDERYSLSTSDRCIVHFVKKRELVRIQDPQTNKEFSVPINSAIKFSVIYNPNNNDSEARLGFNFTLVSDILERSPLPKIGLASLTDPNIEGFKSSEVLVMKEIIFPDNPQDPRRLRVYSLTAKCYRELPETQEVNMTTNPSFMQVYLPDILKHVPNPHSLHISMYRNPLARPLVAPGIPSSMFRRPLYMKKSFTDVLVIATGSSPGSEQEANQVPFEIPTDIDVEFNVIKHPPEEKEVMIEQSRKMRTKLTEKDIRHHRYVGISEEEHRMQMSLYRALREGKNIEESLTSEEAADGDYVKATSGNRLGLNHRVNLLEENLKRCCQFINESKTTIESLVQDNAVLTKKVSDLQDRLAQTVALEDQIEGLNQQVDNIFNELDQLQSSPASSHRPQQPAAVASPTTKQPAAAASPTTKQQVAAASSTTKQPAAVASSTTKQPAAVASSTTKQPAAAASPTTKASTPPEPKPSKEELDKLKWQKNRELLSQKSLAEVVKMLDLAGLSQYKEIIQAEHVNGEVLADCDDGILERDLGIKSKIHRMRFINVIQGKASMEIYSHQLRPGM